MPDTQQDQQSQQKQQESTQLQGDSRPQENWDNSFISQMAGGLDYHTAETNRELAQSYFQLVEDTIRTARRVSEAQVLSQFRTQIVSEVTTQVMTQLKSNPQLIKDAVSR